MIKQEEDIKTLYVDETENDQYFIVTGLLLDNENVAKQIYSTFKKSISNYKLSNKDKDIIYTEFKSTLLDPHFQRIKIKMLKTIVNTKNTIIYSAYIKKTRHLDQDLKEKIYIQLLTKIVSSIDHNVNIVFDSFNICSFETNIINTIIKKENVNACSPMDSQLNPGLQLVDNLCSVIRLHISQKDKNDYYSYIEKTVKKI